MSTNEEEILNDEAEKKIAETVRKDEAPLLFQSNFKPESEAETIRKSGLAYSAGLVLFGSIIFLLFVGWLLDSFLGTSPWCLIGGIVVGSIIGFYQLFSLSAKILKP